MSQTGDATRRRLRFSRKKKHKSPTGDMSLVEHLQELRRRVIISLLALLAGTIVGFIWYQHAPFGTMPLGEILRGPYCELPPESRADFTRDGECRLLATRPFEMFMLRLKVGALAGLVLSSPVWLYQIWAFIVPGLHKKERRSTFTFVTLAVTLFVLGALIAYFIVGFALEFLMTMGTEFAVSALTGQDYYNFLLGLLLIFGVSFEVPLIIVMLNLIGVLEYQTLKEKRRMIILILFVFAAFMTPGQDPFSMVVLAACLVLLVEMAIQFARWNDKRRANQRPEWMDLDDDASSSLSTGPGGLDAPVPVPRPAPIDRPASGFDDVL
ncbi:twin-arginine translocase subunit TatC [Corynebacterium nasicanis]|uniref:Sec-independent protein translocase protein TatC n=1 Tax=Corynebacterium nasicanis TaxID=1448267 RepID=A0ABW1QBB6_9CORY